MLFEDTQHQVTAVQAIGDFSYFVLLSCAVGLAVSLACSLLYKYVSFKDNPGIELTVFLLLAYSTFLVAEFWHCSGILSALVGGVVMSSYAQLNLTDYDDWDGSHRSGHSTAVKSMLQMLAALANMVIFLMVGMALVVCVGNFNLLFTLLVMFFTLVTRGLAVFPLTAVINATRRLKRRIPWGHAVMMWWSGLRGAVALALAVDMPSRHRYMFTSTTCVLIAATSLLYGGRTPSMLKRLKVRTGVPSDDGHDWKLSKSMRVLAAWSDKVMLPLLTSSEFRRNRDAALADREDDRDLVLDLESAQVKLAQVMKVGSRCFPF